MKHHTNSRAAACMLTLGLAAGLAPIAAQAQTAADKWQWEIGIYGWFPAISGTTSFPTGSGGPSIDVSAEDVIKSLKMVFMGQVEARKGQWGVWSDLVYADLGASKDGSRSVAVDGQPATLDGKLSLDVKSTAWTLAGLYNLTSTPENTTDLLFGARMLDIEQTLDWSLTADIPGHPTVGRNGSASAGGTNWDAVVGVKGRYYLGAERKWFLPYYADVGTGESKLTWQINAGVGYQFDWGSLFATYRYLDYEFKSGQTLQSMTMNGVLIGVAFQF